MKHFILPDCQLKPGDDLGFLTAIGKHIVAKKPEVVVCLGDFADMPSLSSYDVGKKSFEGRRYKNDIEVVHMGLEALLGPLWDFNSRAKRNKEKQYWPRLVMTLGNHEERINRAVNNDPKLEGMLSTDDLQYREAGFETYDFLDVVVIDGVAYSHYYVTGVAGRPASSAMAQLRKTNMSCVAGHQQGLQIATGSRADGKRLTSVIAGSCYEHDETYLGPQGNQHYRGALMLFDVEDGQFNLVPIPLTYLVEKYGNRN